MWKGLLSEVAKWAWKMQKKSKWFLGSGPGLAMWQFAWLNSLLAAAEFEANFSSNNWPLEIDLPNPGPCIIAAALHFSITVATSSLRCSALCWPSAGHLAWVSLSIFWLPWSRVSVLCSVFSGLWSLVFGLWQLRTAAVLAFASSSNEHTRSCVCHVQGHKSFIWKLLLYCGLIACDHHHQQQPHTHAPHLSRREMFGSSHTSWHIHSQLSRLAACIVTFNIPNRWVRHGLRLRLPEGRRAPICPLIIMPHCEVRLPFPFPLPLPLPHTGATYAFVAFLRQCRRPVVVAVILLLG